MKMSKVFFIRDESHKTYYWKEYLLVCYSEDILTSARIRNVPQKENLSAWWEFQVQIVSHCYCVAFLYKSMKMDGGWLWWI